MTNDKKQTSVEWLIEQVEGLNINDDTVWAEVTKQALEMEKQQIIDARVNDEYDVKGIRRLFESIFTTKQQYKK